MRALLVLALVAMPVAATAQQVRVDVQPTVPVRPDVHVAPMLVSPAAAAPTRPSPAGPGTLIAPDLMGAPLMSPAPTPMPAADGRFRLEEVKDYLETRLTWEAASRRTVSEPRLEEDGTIALELEGPPGVPSLPLEADPVTGALSGR